MVNDVASECDAQVAKPRPGGTETYRLWEVAQKLGVSVRQLHRLKGKLPGLLKVGASVRFSKAAIDGWLGAK